MKCRHCGTVLRDCFVDLGSAPPSNAYLTRNQMAEPEVWYPLKVMVCDQCWLVQTVDFAGRDELFNANYAYFSSFSSTWLSHAERYVEEMIERFSLNTNSHVIEIAANDGYLLQFMNANNIPNTGIEPTKSTATVAREKGIHIVEDFFGVRLAKELCGQLKYADLITANNVLAHVPDINDFVSGVAVLLKHDGVATFEFPHLLNLLRQNQFDTIYHEHFSYLSFSTVSRIFKSNGLTVFDVEELSTHGGSLRVYAQRSDRGKQVIDPHVEQLLEVELKARMSIIDCYANFQNQVENVKDDLLSFLLQAKNQGKKVAAYGAAAKGNTLLNYAGVRPDLVSFVVDINPAKQGKFMPGSRIQISIEEKLRTDKPDYVIILPWNLKEEVMAQLNYIKDWNGKFVTAIPTLTIL